MIATPTQNGQTVSKGPVKTDKFPINMVKVSVDRKRAVTFTSTKVFAWLFTRSHRIMSTSGKTPRCPAEAPLPKTASAGWTQSMRNETPACKKRTVTESGPTENSTHGAAIAVTGPSGPQGSAPSAPEVLVVDASPTFHDPSSLDDVDGERIPLTEALKRGIDPCPYCYPGWSR